MTPRVPISNARRPHPCLSLRPARTMSGRAFAGVVGVYVVLFAAAALHFWLSAGPPGQ